MLVCRPGARGLVVRWHVRHRAAGPHPLLWEAEQSGQRLHCPETTRHRELTALSSSSQLRTKSKIHNTHSKVALTGSHLKEISPWLPEPSWSQDPVWESPVTSMRHHCHLLATGKTARTLPFLPSSLPGTSWCEWVVQCLRTFNWCQRSSSSRCLRSQARYWTRSDPANWVKWNIWTQEA